MLGSTAQYSNKSHLNFENLLQNKVLGAAFYKTKVYDAVSQRTVRTPYTVAAQVV
jgi:hypothetical protein